MSSQPGIHSFNLQKQLAIRLLLITTCTLAGGVWLLHQGPMNVVRITTPIEEFAPFWYMLSAFPILGMLVADLLDLYRTKGLSIATLELGFQIVLIFVISSARLGIRLPISGHSLILSYFVARRLFIGSSGTPVTRIELGFAILLLLIISYIKLAWWTDPVTLLVGIATGVLLAALSFPARKLRP